MRFYQPRHIQPQERVLFSPYPYSNKDDNIHRKVNLYKLEEKTSSVKHRVTTIIILKEETKMSKKFAHIIKKNTLKKILELSGN